MNAAIRQDLFRHRDTASAALNNLCTVIHKCAAEGAYEGEVGQGERVLGRFRLRCEKNVQTTQVNVDLSMFDDLFRTTTAARAHATDLAVGPEGFAVFHASAHHQRLWVTLTKIAGDKEVLEFDSRKLAAG